MTATININLSDGLSSEEIVSLQKIAATTGATMDQIILRALREGAKALTPSKQPLRAQEGQNANQL